MNDPVSSIAQLKTTALDLLVRFGPKVLAALLVLAAGVVVSRYTARWLGKGLERIQLEPPVRQLLVRIASVLILLIFVIMALQNLGLELLPLIAGLGIAGAGIALAMQGVLSNVAAGLTIIFTRPFRVSEYISVAGVEGRVVTISLFSTTLDHVDRSRVVVPNRKIVGEILHNYGQIRQLDLTVGVAYGTDLDAALAAIDDVMRGSARVLKDPAAVVQTSRLADSSIEIAIRPWVSVPDFGVATGEINKAVVETFHRKGIVIPFPQRQVRLIGSGSPSAG
ncbi:MAG TPA: mechanosensitive ion channel family protein [Steroidobacteraceae bacterium]|nr:mechanosensitive ion channel family protein [Steroidobacteraceae bacterium]